MSDEFPKHLYKHPGPYGLAQKSYAVLGVADAEEEKAGLAKGWSLTMEDAWAAGPLDHDKDGKKGGSKSPAPAEDLADLRAEYEKAHGKKPFNGWDADELKAKIAAKAEEAGK